LSRGQASSQQREQQPGGGEAPADPDRGDQRGRDDRAGRDRCEHQALQDPEDPCEHCVRDRALQQREKRDIDDRVADSDAGEQKQRRIAVRPGTNDRDR
jgi:hypothetical protein